MPTDRAIGLALQQSLNLTFWAMLLISLTIVILALMVPPVEIRQAVEVPAEQISEVAQLKPFLHCLALTL
jgi:hypothetical protein